MPKSLSLRFNGNRDEVVEYARSFGIGRAMDKFGVKDYLAMTRFLKEAGGEDIVDNPMPNLNAETTIDQFLFKVTRAIARLETDNKRLREENEYLKVVLNEKREDILRKMKLIAEQIE